MEIILVKLIPQQNYNSSDLFIKILAAAAFEKHAKVCCSDKDIET
jgi:hypothetical protein